MSFRSLAATLISSILTWAAPASAFVLLAKTPHRLASTPEAPTVTFVWDEQAPVIEKKEALFSNEKSGLDDVEYMALTLQLAMDQWNEVHGSYLRMALSRDSAAVADGEDGVHTITIDTSGSLTSAAFASPNFQVGGKESNTIGDCDIHVYNASTSARDLIYTLVHELGHCVGLGHNHSNYKSIMGYARQGQSNSYELGADDKSGAMWLYPDPAVIDESPTELVACGVVSGAGKNDSEKTGMNLMAGILLALPLIWVGLAGKSARGRT